MSEEIVGRSEHNAGFFCLFLEELLKYKMVIFAYFKNNPLNRKYHHTTEIFGIQFFVFPYWKIGRNDITIQAIAGFRDVDGVL